MRDGTAPEGAVPDPGPERGGSQADVGRSGVAVGAQQAVALPDFEQAIDPLTAEQTQAVLRLLIDAHYGGPQPLYAVTDLAVAHADLDEALGGAR